MEDDTVRDNGKRLLKDQMLVRAAETKVKYKITEEEVSDFVEDVEKELYDLYNDVGFKYKAKFRSLLFNIKDRSNLYLWEQICKKKISPYELVRLTPKELASRELAKWREREMKKQLELVKRREIELLAANKTYVLKTHKGDRVMKEETATKAELDPDVPVEEIVSVLNDTNKEKNKLKVEKGHTHTKNPENSYTKRSAKDITNDDLYEKEIHLPTAMIKDRRHKIEFVPKEKLDLRRKNLNINKDKISTTNLQPNFEIKDKIYSKGPSNAKKLNKNKEIKLYEVNLFSQTSIDNGIQSVNNNIKENLEGPAQFTTKTKTAEKSKQKQVNNCKSDADTNRKTNEITNDEINTDLRSGEKETLKDWSNKSFIEKQIEVAKILNRVNDVLIKEQLIDGKNTKEPNLKNNHENTAKPVTQKLSSAKPEVDKLDRKARKRIKTNPEDSERKLRSWSKYNLRSKSKKEKELDKKVSKKDIHYFIS